ncbi:hypothetical protein BUALT_Bualt05G0058800 [Buddleja alternifolia]|nr:hypothetical protein BUALT_Bualt05G0058700 [Buddleja alternifolia]KAG8382265.1 hypothetical protein BUALT_Bualt05G0058800 [Buddleja alternifolia]
MSSDGRVPNDGVCTQKQEEEEQFLRMLKSLGCESYMYHKDMIMEHRCPEAVYNRIGDVIEMFRQNGFQFLSLSVFTFSLVMFLRLGYPIIKPMDVGAVKHYSYSEMKEITESFNKSNFICKTMSNHGKLFKGTIKNGSKPQDVIVKTWDFVYPPMWACYHHTHRIHDELLFLRDPGINSHPNVVNVIGFHCDERLAVIYEGIRLKCILKELLLSDDFQWENRLKVAIDIASLLMTFHRNGHVHGGVMSDCIMLDEELCPITFNFRLYYYNVNKKKCFGPYTVMNNSPDQPDQADDEVPRWCMGDDVFAYGILLLELITKRKGSSFSYRDWLHVQPKFVVHESFDVKRDIASEITDLAYWCLKLEKQPSLEHVIGTLKKCACTTAMKKQKC